MKKKGCSAHLFSLQGEAFENIYIVLNIFICYILFSSGFHVEQFPDSDKMNMDQYSGCRMETSIMRTAMETIVFSEPLDRKEELLFGRVNTVMKSVF